MMIRRKNAITSRTVQVPPTTMSTTRTLTKGTCDNESDIDIEMKTPKVASLNNRGGSVSSSSSLSSRVSVTKSIESQQLTSAFTAATIEQDNDQQQRCYYPFPDECIDGGESADDKFKYRNVGLIKKSQSSESVPRQRYCQEDSEENDALLIQQSQPQYEQFNDRTDNVCRNNVENKHDESSHNNNNNIKTRRPVVRLLPFALMTVFLFADQNLMAPNLSAIAADFNMSDTERDTKLGGQIALAFFMIGAPASIVFGYLTDHPPQFGTKPTRLVAFIFRVMGITTVNNNDTSKPCYYRIRLFCLTVLLGEVSCCMTAFVQTFDQLYTCRALTGFSIGGAFPILFSLLGDWFTPDERHLVSAVTGLGTGVGIALGQAVAGYVGPLYGWRIPFIIVSIPAIVLALIIGTFMQDPPRGATEHQYLKCTNPNGQQQQKQQHHVDQTDEETSHSEYQQQFDSNELTLCNGDGAPQGEVLGSSEQSSTSLYHPLSRNIVGAHDTNDTSQGLRQDTNDQDGRSHNMLQTNSTDHTVTHHSTERNWIYELRILLTTPTVVLALLQGGPGCVPWGVVNTYLNDYLSTDRGMSVQGATTVLLIFGVGIVVGQMIAGVAGTYLYKRYDARYPALLASVSAIVGCIPFYMLLHINSSTSWFIIGLIAFLAGLCSSFTGPIIKATLQNVTIPNHRGTAFGLFNIADDFGRGLGPVYVAGLIELTKSRSKAFAISIIGWVICGILNGLVFFFVRKDEQKVRNSLQQ